MPPLASQRSSALTDLDVRRLSAEALERFMECLGTVLGDNGMENADVAAIQAELTDAIRALKPDAGVTRDYCEACGYTDSHDPNCPRPKPDVGGKPQGEGE